MAKLIDEYRAIVQGEKRYAPIADLIGFKLIEVREGVTRFEMPVDERMHNTIGVVQGGAITAVADAAMGNAACTLMPEDKVATTVELKINFVKAIKKGKLTVIGRVVSHGSRIMLAEAEVLDEKNKLVARATSTLMVLDKEKA
ncbi:MAG TPA: PaaI family thioesterase [Methanomassiliicoccales archaeon]|nr:PaaI family thioesterase [Methanomassiliicoccales archaeon]